MSKVHLAVLGFINYKPMYGYEILNIISTRKMDVWAGIKMPSVYNALAHLEEKHYIIGVQQTEGNNPPRTVYSLSPEGHKYLVKLIDQYLSDEGMESIFWFALSFVYKTHTFLQFVSVIKSRIEKLQSHMTEFHKVHGEECKPQEEKHPVSFIHKHILLMGNEVHKTEIEILEKLYNETINNKDSEVFLKEG